MIKQCVFCQEDFEAKTKRSKYCSDSCKLKFNRGTSITANKSPEEIRELKYKEMQNQTTVDEDTGEVLEVSEIKIYREGKPLLKSDDEKRFGDVTKEEAEAILEEYESKFNPKTARREHIAQVKLKKGGVFCSCTHCGEIYGASGTQCALYCKQCKTKDQRDYIDKLNYCVDIINS